MAVMARETWTDERLDDLRGDLNKGFDESKKEVRDLRIETKGEFQRVRADMDKGFKEVKGEIKDLRVEMNARFGAVDARFDANQRTMVLGFASIVASILATQL